MRLAPANSVKFQRDVPDQEARSLKVLDLFCGAGGLASGFKKAGFNVTGVDISEYAQDTFRFNHFGEFKLLDLSKEVMDGDYDAIIGGPPCRPWSNVNLTNRGKEHKDYQLVSVFFEHVERLKPRAFLFENVFPVAHDDMFLAWIAKMEGLHYSVHKMRIRYSDYGAATTRGRFFAFGLAGGGDAAIFEKRLKRHKTGPRTVKHEIWSLRNKQLGEAPDHIWPQLNTIDSYKDRYESGQYGWYVLKWGEPAPSFGNVMKTYILHPESFNGGTTRVISVRESYRIMGFDSRFRFPRDNGMGKRYQMVVDSVSPIFSKKAAKVIKQLLSEDVKN